MRRKTIGFLLLLLLVAAGITFVEFGKPDPDAWREADGPVYRVVLGGRGAVRDGSGSTATAKSSDRSDGGDPHEPDHGADVESRGPTDDAAGASPPKRFRYVVQSGDVLGAIVRDYLGSAAEHLVQRVARENGLADPNAIEPGTALSITVERYDRYSVARGESLSDVALRQYGSSDRTRPLRRVNAGLPSNDRAELVEGTALWVPR